MKRPSLLHALAEPVRASGEFVTSLGLLPLRRMLPEGDGQPVLVLPGFTATDRSTLPLRRMLRSLGYPTSGWGLGRNMGPTEKVMSKLPGLLERIATEAGRSVSLVGWSLGGVFARQLAARRPKLVRSLVTLGTPVRPEVHGASNASTLFDALQAIHVRGHPLLDNGEPLDVPVTAVHTKSDGIVPWQTCLVQDAPRTENLRVRGSHIGLGFNPAAEYVVADRLALPEGVWTPFVAPAPYRGIITTERAAATPQ
jgi:fermentation-respiration switch protein FrsA (DUF1100 family)